MPSTSPRTEGDRTGCLFFALGICSSSRFLFKNFAAVDFGMSTCAAAFSMERSSRKCNSMSVSACSSVYFRYGPRFFLPYLPLGSVGGGFLWLSAFSWLIACISKGSPSLPLISMQLSFCKGRIGRGSGCWVRKFLKPLNMVDFELDHVKRETFLYWQWPSSLFGQDLIATRCVCSLSSNGDVFIRWWIIYLESWCLSEINCTVLLFFRTT